MGGRVSVWRAESGNTFTKSQDKEIGRQKEWTADQGCRVIGEGAFKNNTKLRSVILPEHVKEVGVKSFENTSLRNVEMKGIVSVRKEAFYNCTRLSQVRIPRTANFIGKRAFAQCRRLEQVQIERGSVCREIKPETFAGCSNLNSVNIPDGITRIERRAFYKCTALEEMKFPAGLKEIGTEAFYQTALKELTLPEGLVKIGDSAFLKCNQLEYVCIPESVKVIEKWAFHGCNRLKILEIPGDPVKIGPWIINRSAKIRCRKGGIADAYCQESGFQVEYIEKEV